MEIGAKYYINEGFFTAAIFTMKIRLRTKYACVRIAAVRLNEILI